VWCLEWDLLVKLSAYELVPSPLGLYEGTVVAVLLGRVAKKKPYLRLANKK
jgi:hypothetical protein